MGIVGGVPISHTDIYRLLINYINIKNIIYKSHPKYKIAKIRKKEFITNKLFGNNMKLRKFINLFIEDNLYLNKIKTYKNIKKYKYFGYEKYEHPVPGNMKISKLIYI